MKVTKYQHACFTIEQDGTLLVVDPGVFTHDLGTPTNVVAIVVTHEHPDHLDPDTLVTLFTNNPDAVLVAHHTITEKMASYSSRPVLAGEMLDVGSFNLKFYGGEHATIHSSIPSIANLGVLINDSLYYPGDSFTVPDQPVKALALPVTAPWLKISEVIDFSRTIQSPLVFPTHDAIASDEGKALYDRMLSDVIAGYGGSYQRLASSIEI